MTERNLTRYRLDQSDNKVYILSTSLVNDKLKLTCQDSNSQTYIGAFTLLDLLNLSKYFKTTRSVDQVQQYLNGIVEKQRVEIYQDDKCIKVILHLINNDRISIPLKLKITDDNSQTYTILSNNNSDNDFSKLKSEISDLKIQLNNKNKIIENLNTKIQALENKLNSITNKYNEKTSLIQDLQNNINKKDQELQQLKSQLNTYYISKPGAKFGFPIKFQAINSEFDLPMICNENESISRLEEELYNQYPKYKDLDTYLICGGRVLKRFRTVKENNIKKYDTILVNIKE